MTLPLVAVCAAFGLLIGSFLNVVVHRVPIGQSVVRPASACPGCSSPIAVRDNVPVLSWLLLAGRCRHCSSRISARYPVVELGCAALFAVMAARFGAHAALPAYLYLAAVGLALALIDIDVRRLPDVLTLPSYPVALVLLALAALAEDHGSALARAAVGGVAMLALYFLLWFAHPGGMGFGDVKLAGVLGLYLGWISYGTLAVGVFLGFLFGAIYGVGVMLVGSGGRKTKVPFGPFMLLGTLTAVLVGRQLVDAYLGVLVG